LFVCRTLQIPDNKLWLGVFNKALLELTDPYNWEHNTPEYLTPEEAAAACYAIFEQYLSGEMCNAPAPYWDTPNSADDTAAPDTYGQIDDLTFVENIAIWGITSFIAYAGNIGAALQFATFAPRFVLAWKKSGIGGAIRVFIDGVDHGLIDTNDPAGGIVEQAYYPADAPSHTIVQVLESVPAAAPGFRAGDPSTASMQVIRKRLQAAEVDVITNLRQAPGSGQLEMERAGEWLPVPTANNVRIDGSTTMTGNLEIADPLQENQLTAYRSGDLPVAVRLRTDAAADADWSVFIEPVTKVFGIKNNVIALPALTIAPATPERVVQILATSVVVRRVATGNNGETSAFNVRRNGAVLPTAGYGVIQTFSADDATHVDRVLAQLHVRYLNAAAASYRAEMYATVNDVVAAREGWRIASNGSAPMISVLGAPVQLRQTISGERQQNPALAALLTALAAFGWITDSTTAGTLPVGPAGPAGPPGEPGPAGEPAETPLGDLEQSDGIAEGDCVDYDLKVQGNQQLLLPCVVQPGYTINFTYLSGAASDGGTLDLDEPVENIFNWYCPNGQQYFLGGCTGAGTSDPGDPLPSAPHMALIMSLNGILSFVGAGGLYTVPAGANNVMPVFQVNDSVLADNSGDFSFHVQICNPLNACADYADPLTTALGPKTYIATPGPTDLTLLPSFPGATGAYDPAGGESGGGSIIGTAYSAEGIDTFRLAVVVDLGRECTVTSATARIYRPTGGYSFLYLGLYGEDEARLEDRDTPPGFTGWVGMTQIDGLPVAGVRYIYWFAEMLAGSGPPRLDSISITTS